MVAYQKFGVIGLSITFSILQKLKFQIFRLFVVYDICRRSSECDNSTTLVNSSDVYFEDDLVEQFIFKSLTINNCVSILPCVFLAAWSDKHGRKLLLSLPFVGSIIGDVFMIVSVFVPSSPKDILLVSEAIYGFCGGTVLISLGCMCYITDSTDHRLRTWFMGIFLGVLNVLPVIDMILKYYLTPLKIQLDFKTLVVSGISIRFILSIFFLAYIKFFVMESVFVLGSYHGNPWTNLLTPINVSDTVNCVFKRRLDNMRFFIIALCTVFIFYCLLIYGNITIFPLHFRKDFHWHYQDIIIAFAILCICQTLALWLSCYTALKFRFLDIDLGTYGGFSLTISCLALTFIKNSWVAIIGTLIGIASLLIPTSIISVLSKLIERVETGSMYAGIGFLMLVTQLAAQSSYTKLYEVCSEAGMPQVVFLLSFGLATFGVLFLIYLRKNISPDLLGHLNPSESLALINRKGEVERLFE